MFRTEPNWNRRSKPKIPRTFRRQLAPLRDQAAARCRLLRVVRLRGAPSHRFRQAHEVERDGYFQARRQLQQVAHLRLLSEGNQRQVDRHDPELRQRPRVVRPRHLNAVGGRADRQQQRPHRSNNSDRRNVADRQLASWARVRIRLVARRMFHRVAADHLNVSASAPLRQLAWGQPRVAVGNRGHRRGCVIRSRRRLPADLPAKRVAGDHRVRASINPAGRRELERLPQPSTAPVNLSMEIKGPKNRRLHPGHNNFGAIFTAAPEKNSGAAFFV